MHSADDFVMCLGDFNGHVGRHIDGFDMCMADMVYVRGIWKKNVIRILYRDGIMCVKYMV